MIRLISKIKPKDKLIILISIVILVVFIFLTISSTNYITVLNTVNPPKEPLPQITATQDDSYLFTRKLLYTISSLDVHILLKIIT